MRSALSYPVVYAWFVVIGKIVWWSDFSFVKYDGPSTYLEFCSWFGIFGLWTIGMLPIALVIYARYYKDDLRNRGWILRDFVQTIALSVMLVILCLSAEVVIFGTIGAALSWASDGASNAFIRFTTAIRQ